MNRPRQLPASREISGTNAPDLIGGSPGNDVISGGNGNDTIAGLPGADSIFGGNGSDDLYGDDGADALYGENGDDYLDGGPGPDLLVGDNGGDVLVGGPGDDDLYGDNGGDIFFPGSGFDLVDGGRGEDVAIYELFAADLFAEPIPGGFSLTMPWGETDLLYGIERLRFEDGDFFHDGGRLVFIPAAGPPDAPGGGVRLVEGGPGDDDLFGGDGAQNIFGYGGSDILRGGSDGDALFGGSGDDVLSGGDGNDLLIGGRGFDFLDGGNGKDRAVYEGVFAAEAVIEANADGSFTVFLPDGTDDRLVRVEEVAFDDGVVLLDTGENDAAFLLGLYEASFGRSAGSDPGLLFWAARRAEGLERLEIAELFYESDEFDRTVGRGASHEDFVNELYDHVLGRGADPQGRIFWTDQLDWGMPEAEALARFADSAEKRSETDALLDDGLFFEGDPDALLF